MSLVNIRSSAHLFYSWYSSVVTRHATGITNYISGEGLPN